jgi:hypothetical protein
MSKVYAIVDVGGYVAEMRKAAAQSFTENYNENLDDFISINQMINLLYKHCVGFDDLNRPMLDEESNNDIYEDTVIWLHNVGLAKLAAQNLVECAWDDKLNEMVFWQSSSQLTLKTESEIQNEPKRKRKNKKSQG